MRIRIRIVELAVAAGLLMAAAAAPAQNGATPAPLPPGVRVDNPSMAPPSAAELAKPDSEIPTDWIDATTGHRIIRLSHEAGTTSLYFHYNSFPPGGDKVVVTNPEGIAAIDLNTHATTQIVEGAASYIIVGRKTRQVFYLRNGDRMVCATDIDTKKTREIAKLPDEFKGGSGFGVSADDKLLAGSYIIGGVGGQSPPDARGNGNLQQRWANRAPMALYTVDTETGAIKTFGNSPEWLNHVQMSPVDPGLIMFCHEGPWQMTNRTWTIRADGSGLTQIHQRTMQYEIEGHEFFGPDGNIWYDLQTPIRTFFWVAGYDVKSGLRTWYHLTAPEWSVHYNISPDGKLFSGDGGGPTSVAAPNNGQFIYLFHPHLNREIAGAESDQSMLVRTGYFEAEKLVDLSKHNYSLEPNGMFTPDGKWIVFRSNMFGPTHVFEVEVAKH
jgi:oligogalacturonide lyase